MSNSNTNLQTQSSNALHNAIMEAGSKDRPPMLAPVNVQFLLQLQPERQRFVTLVKKSQELKTVSYHKLYDILKQHQNEVNEIRAKRLARTANPLALVAQQQPVYHHQNHPTQNTQYSSSRSQQSMGSRGKAIVTSSTLTYDLEPDTVTEDDEISKDKEIDKLMALISLLAVNVVGARENVGTLIQEVTPDPVDNSGPIFDDEPMHKVQNNNDNYNMFAMENEHPENNLNSSNDIYLGNLMNAILGVYTDLDEVTSLQCDYLDTMEKCMYKVPTKPNQTRTQRLSQDIRKTNQRVSFSTGVIPTTSVSRPQLKSNQLEDRVMPNISQGKKQEVEDHRRNFKFSNNKTSVTVCNDSLNAKTLNVNFVSVTCGKCVLNDNHNLCVLHYINGVNSRTRQPMAVPISTREPKHNVNQSVATSSKKTVTTDSTVKKSRQITRKLVEIILFIVDSGCSKHMTGNLKLLTNFMEKFLGMVKFGNDQIAPILGYGDLVQGTITIKRVYYVEGLNHNLFSVGQFCDADLEVAFRKSTCYIRDLKGNDLLTGSRGTDLYSITLQDSTTPNLIYFWLKANIVSSMVMASSSISFKLRHHKLAFKE
ncbi:hypothetical protein Tco_0929794 [Tanacetum coccineum]